EQGRDEGARAAGRRDRPVPAGPRAQVGDRERVARSGRVAPGGPRRHPNRGLAGEDEGAAGAEGHHDLGNAELAQLLELAATENRLRLLLGELEDRDMPEKRSVEVAVELERADPSRANEAVSVEKHAPPVRDPLERRRREVVAQERRDVHPLDPAQRALRAVGLAPWLADLVDLHLATA